MEDVIRITADKSPGLHEVYLPIILENGAVVYPPEFWIEVTTSRQQTLIDLFNQHNVCFKIFEIVDIEPKVSMAVCRYNESYNKSFPVIQKICRSMGVDKIIVSNGELFD